MFNFCKRSELEFCQRIDALVAGFNGVAGASDESVESKTVTLSALFDHITNLGIAEIANAVKNPEYIEQAHRRVVHVLDILNDDENDFAPQLVRDETMWRALSDEGHEWHSLAKHWDANLQHLRGMLEAFSHAEQIVREQKSNPDSPPSADVVPLFTPAGRPFRR